MIQFKANIVRDVTTQLFEIIEVNDGAERLIIRVKDSGCDAGDDPLMILGYHLRSAADWILDVKETKNVPSA